MSYAFEEIDKYLALWTQISLSYNMDVEEYHFVDYELILVL